MMTKAKQPEQGQRSIKTFFSKPSKPARPRVVPVDDPVSEDPEPPPTASKEVKRVPTSRPESKPIAKTSTTASPSAQSPAATTRPGADLTGKQVSVYWPDDKAWYEGSIEKFDASQQKHFISYEDGEEEWVDLCTEKYKVVSPGGKPQAKRPRKNAQVLLSSDSESEAPEPSPSGSGSDFAADEEAKAVSSEDDESLVDDEDTEMEDSPEPRQAARKGRQRPDSTAKKVPPSKKARTTKASTPATAPSKSHSTAGRPVSTAKKSQSAQKQPGAAAKLASASSGLPDSGTPPKGLEASDDWQRYTQRAAQKFPFLHPDRIMDANRHRPGQPGYNPRTLHIPPTWFKDNKISEGQRQWWTFKAAHFDSVMLFKMGKFYEMFEMDAHVGSDVLGLSYMRGEQPHAGFPEANYHQHAERLARAGLRVVVIEQTETPDQLKVRNEERRAKGQTKAGVVNRELVAVLTQGTLSDPDMLRTYPDAAYLLALLEVPLQQCTPGEEQEDGEIDAGPDATVLAACAVDVASGHMLLGQWEDDAMRTRLRALLGALQPAELVLPSSGLEPATNKVLKAGLKGVRTNSLEPGREFWGADKTKKEIVCSDYGSSVGTKASQAALPPLLKGLLDITAGEHAPVVSALGGCLSYLRSLLLDKSVMAMCRPEWLPQSSIAPPAGAGGVSHAQLAPRQPQACLALDGNALESLEVLESSEGGTSGSLLGTLDRCVTAAGRRRLKAWLCRPLASIADITARQDAVEDLMTRVSDAACTARQQFAGVGDLDRAIARIQAACAGAIGRDSEAVVLYEDAAKRRVTAFVAALTSLKAVQAAMQSLQEVASEMHSTLLQGLVTPGELLPDMAVPLAELLEAADWDQAIEQGRIIPTPGANREVDDVEAALNEMDNKLDQHLQDARKLLGGGISISYVPLHKESHVLEIPQSAEKKVPAEWERLAQRKGYSRYMSPALRKLTTRRASLLADRELALSGVLKGLLQRFSQHRAVWGSVVEAMAQVDALCSLASAANDASAHGPVCRPCFVEPAELPATAMFRAKQLRHPAAAAVGDDSTSFVPNDVCLGGENPAFLLLTGPNMGGKSTLLRQVCLATVMAQVGAWVPAASLTLTPADALFVRSGARDAIMSGQSTFFVELAETAAALQRATPNSLVALDELGRGTATSDGAAIAAAVLEHLTKQTRCRGMFATHYHRLADDHAEDALVAIKHMACHVAPDDSGQGEQVAFLYKLTDGACPKSYGPNVARLAGLPASIVQRAAQLSAQLETKAAQKGSSLTAAVASMQSSTGQEQLPDAAQQLIQAMHLLATDGQDVASSEADWVRLGELAAQA